MRSWCARTSCAMCRWARSPTRPRSTATTLSIVAVFLPIGFMEGIIGKFFHEFGITIVAAVMISMSVSFTLDPMMSSVWHDPSIEAHGQAGSGTSFYDRTIGRVTGAFHRTTERLAEGYQKLLRW